MALFYGPLWVIMALVFAMYLITILGVLKSYNAVRASTGTSFYVLCCMSFCARFKTKKRVTVYSGDQGGDVVSVRKELEQPKRSIFQASNSSAERDDNEQTNGPTPAKLADVSSLELQMWLKEAKVYLKLLLWPLAFLLAWIMPTVNRVYYLIVGTPIEGLTMAHLISVSMHAALNLFIYFANPLEHSSYVRNRCIKACCGKKGFTPRSIEDDAQMLVNDDNE